MSQRTRASIGRWVLLALACTLLAPRAHADDQRCIEAHSKAQGLRRDGRLMAAREQLRLCAEPVCPELIRGDCATWLSELDKELPSIVVSARIGETDVSDARVLVDGRAVAEELDGKSIELDPGRHRVRLERDGERDVEREIVAKLGVKNEGVLFQLEATPSLRPAEPKAEAGPDRTLVYVLGGVGVVGLASFTYFGLKGKSDYDRLRDECSPTCEASESDSVKQSFLIADLSLGVGVASLAVATYILLSDPAPEPRRAVSGPRPWLGLGAQPVAGGAVLRVGGSL